MTSLWTQLGRFANGRRVGLYFIRNKWFAMPRQIVINETVVRLSYPAERGIKTDFVACVIRNDYGLGRQMKNVQTILDVGANVGFFSLAARATYPNATIHAYEPNPRILSSLTANTFGLGIEVYPESVGQKAGRAFLDDPGESNLAQTRLDCDGNIPQVSFENTISRLGGRIDLLKLDCEGAEWDLFDATQCWTCVDHLRMEYHLTEHRTLVLVERRLSGLGFEITHHQQDLGCGIIWARNISAGG